MPFSGQNVLDARLVLCTEALERKNGQEAIDAIDTRLEVLEGTVPTIIARVQDASDVNFVTFDDQDFLQWDIPSGKIRGVTLPAPVLDLNGLTDVALATVTIGDLLVRGITEWQNIHTPAAGQVLTSTGVNSVPTWQALPASVAAFDDLTDVTLTSVARGDLLYRGASQWVNLAAGASGRLLTANGAGADPSWIDAPTTYQQSGAGAAVRQLSAKAQEFVSVKDFGAVGDGVTDDSTAFTNAITAAYNTLGRLYVPPGAYLINSALTLPNEGGGGVPKQRPLVIFGAGAQMCGNGFASVTGTVLKLAYAGAGPAKLDTRGAGYLELAGLTFQYAGNDTVPILQTTNTTLHIHDCAFFGTKILTACDQDAIILGGTSTTSDGSANAPFQGYGTVIRDCYFDKIRRAVYGRTYCNGVTIADNTLWNSCGSNLSDGAAMELLGISGNACSGNVFRGNLFEVGAYPYGVKSEYSNNCSFLANNFYDPTATTIAYIRTETNSQYHVVMAGFGSDTKPTLSDGGGRTTLITGHQSRDTIFTEPVLAKNTLRNLSSQGIYIEDTTIPANQWAMRAVGTAINTYKLQYVPSGAGTEDLFVLERLSSTSHRITMSSTATNLFRSFGNLQVFSNAAATLSLGDASNSFNVVNGQIRGIDGSVSAPSISLKSDTNTGVHWVSADILALVTGGVERQRWDASGLVTATVADAATNAATLTQSLLHNSSGTPAAGFGSEQRWKLKTSTTNDRDASGWRTTWATATEGSQRARVACTVWDTAEREWIRGESNGSAAMVGLFGHAAALQPAAYTPSNYTTSRVLNGSTATLNDVINALGTLIADLQSYGAVG